MPRSPDGSYNLPSGTIVSSGDTILPSQHNPAMQDIAQAMGNSLDRDGSGTMRAPLDMGGYPVQNAGSGSASNDLATVGQATGAGVPIGTVMDYAGTAAPSNYLFCYGQAISRSTYAALFTAIGTTYGSGDGSTTFNLPDCRGRVTAGKDNMGGTSANRLTGQPGGLDGDNLAAAGGAETHTLTTAQMAAHAHSGSTSSAGAHTHSGTLGIGYGGSWLGSAGLEEGRGAPDWRAGAMGSAGDHTHSFTTSQSGGDDAHNNVQPTIIFNKIMKVSAA